MGLFDQPPRDVAKFLANQRAFGTTDRYRAATQAEKYYLSLQYDAMLDWDRPGPIKKKKPRIIVPLFKTAIDRLNEFIWGGARFPKTVVHATRQEDDGIDQGDVGPELYPEDARDLTTFVADLVKKANLDDLALEFSKCALITTSCAVIVGLRGGNLVSRVEVGKHCTPQFDPNNPRKLSALEIRYQYEREESTGQQGFLIKKTYWYRRVVDDMRDVVYKPVEVRPGEYEPEWEVDPDLSAEHDLGFCPVVWVRTLPVSADSVDGQPVIDPALYPLLDRVNYTVSQRDRAVEYTQDPQFYTKGVPTNQRNVFQKSPGNLWHLDKDAEVHILEMQGSGQDAASLHLLDLRQRFLEAIGVVLAEPEWLRGSAHVSGIVLEYLYAPMMALASMLRRDVGSRAFVDIVNLMLRICATCVERGEAVWIPGVKKAANIISKSQLDGPYLDFTVELQWAPYFTPNAQDQQLKVATAMQAVAGGLISKLTAVRFLADVFSILDADAEGEAAEKDMEKMMQSDYGPLLQPPGAPMASASTKPKAATQAKPKKPAKG